MNPALNVPNRNKSIATRTLACVAFVCFVLISIVIPGLMALRYWGEAGKDYTTVHRAPLSHQARLSHRAFAPLEINYTLHLPLLNNPNGPSSFQPLPFANVTATGNDQLALLRTQALSSLPCAILHYSLSSAESSYDAKEILDAFSAANSASIALGNLDDYYAQLFHHYQRVSRSSLSSEKAFRPPWFKSFLCPQKASVKKYLGGMCLFESDIERHTHSKAWVVTVDAGIEGARREKKAIAKKKVEVRKFEEELALFVTRIRKEGTLGEDDVKQWYFENVAQVGGQVWRDFDQEYGRLDCTIRDNAELDLGAADGDTEEVGSWNLEEIWAR